MQQLVVVFRNTGCVWIGSSHYFFILCIEDLKQVVQKVSKYNWHKDMNILICFQDILKKYLSSLWSKFRPSFFGWRNFVCACMTVFYQFHAGSRQCVAIYVLGTGKKVYNHLKWIVISEDKYWILVHLHRYLSGSTAVVWG